MQGSRVRRRTAGQCTVKDIPSAPAYRRSSNTYRVNIGGVERGPYPLEHVRELATRRELNPTDAVSYAGQAWVPAVSAPGIYSDKSYVVAMLLSFLLGALGIDRFYLGQIGLGVASPPTACTPLRANSSRPTSP